MLTRMRIWLPDAPGVLGAVAAELGALQGNVVGLEVLERDAGVAIDELVVELPDEIGILDAVCRGVRNVPGAGVEEVRELVGEAPDREDTVLAAAAAILQVRGRPPRRWRRWRRPSSRSSSCPGWRWRTPGCGGSPRCGATRLPA